MGSSPLPLAGPRSRRPATEVVSRRQCGELNRSGRIFSRLNVQLNKGANSSLRTSSGPASCPWASPSLACQWSACGASSHAAPLSTPPR